MAVKALPSRRSKETTQRARLSVTGWLVEIVKYTILLALAASFLLPFYWMASSALKDDAQIYVVPPKWFPDPIYPFNFWNAWHIQNFNLFAFNTIFKYAVPATIGTVLSSAIVAYGFSRMRWPGRDALFAVCLATMMIPSQVRLVPLFIIFKNLGWINTYLPLVVPAFFGNAFFIFMLRQFFRSIPMELSEAARIDGANEVSTFFRIILPLAKPALTVVALLSFMGAWNDYFGPLIYVNREEQWTLALGVQRMGIALSEHGASAMAYPYLMAVSTIVTLPILLAFFFAQRAFIEGISMSGLKGWAWMRRRTPHTTIKQAPRTPYVAFQPRARQAIQRGINVLANAIRPTLGPTPRLVAVEPIGPGDKRPELLDNGGLIARRFLALRDRDADMGAMFLRHVLWRQHERAGDGTAITAVLFQSIYNQGCAYLAAGGNAMQVRRHLERGLRVILDELKEQAIPLEGQEQIVQMAESICHDAALATMLGEIFDIVSEDGPIDIRSGRGREIEREYVTGTYFKGKLFSEWMITDQQKRSAQLEDAAILVSDLEFDDPSALAPLLRLASQENIRSLMIMAKDLSEQAIAALLAASREPLYCRIIAAKAPDAVSGQAAMLDDLAILTGARLFVRAAGDTLQKVKPQDLGQARRVWADDEFFGVAGGKDAPHSVRAHVSKLRMALNNVEDQEARKKIRERLGKLLGGTAILRVGGMGDIAIKTRKELAERTIAALRIAIGRGALPGGGVALLACRSTLRRMADQAEDLDERMAFQILSRALEEPARTILRNAGYDPSALMDQIDRAGPRCGLDVRSGCIIDMARAGIVDSAGVLSAAAHEAVASAALALTIDVLVHKQRPEMSFEP